MTDAAAVALDTGHGRLVLTTVILGSAVAMLNATVVDPGFESAMLGSSAIVALAGVRSLLL